MVYEAQTFTNLTVKLNFTIWKSYELLKRLQHVLKVATIFMSAHAVEHATVGQLA